MGGHNNQPKDVVDGEGGVGEEMRPGRNVWGTLSHCLGRQMEASNNKNREMGWALAIDSRRSKILHATTNQKQVAGTEGTMKGRRDKQEALGKHNTIFLGGITVEWRLKTKIKSLSLLIIFFSARLYYLVKPRDTALSQPLP